MVATINVWLLWRYNSYVVMNGYYNLRCHGDVFKFKTVNVNFYLVIVSIIADDS